MSAHYIITDNITGNTLSVTADQAHFELTKWFPEVPTESADEVADAITELVNDLGTNGFLAATADAEAYLNVTVDVDHD